MPRYPNRKTSRMNADHRTIGNNVRAARTAAGLNKPTIGARLYLAGYETMYEQSLGRIERGERGITLAEAVALADAIGCSLDEFTHGLPADTDDEELIE